MAEIDYSALFGDDSGAAQNQAALLAQAMRRRRAAGTLGLITGDPAMSAVGQNLAGNADKQEQTLVGAAQHRAQQQLQEKHYATEEARQKAQEEFWKAQVGNRSADLGLKATELVPVRDAFGNTTMARKHALPGAVGAGGGQPRPAGPGPSNPASDIADAIMEGKQPPDMKGMFRIKPLVTAELAKRGFDLSSAQRDWGAVQKHVATLNGPQQTRLVQAASTAMESLGNIEKLYNEWKQLGGAGGYKVFNKMALSGSKQVPGRLGEVAQALEMNIADLTAELGNVYMGGNSPTEEALKLAKQNLSADWNEGQFTEGIKQARKNIGFRLNAIRSAGTIGASPGNKYELKQPTQEETPAAPATVAPKATHRFNPKTGKIEVIQ